MNNATQGLSFSGNYVTIGALVVDWSPLEETGTFIGFLTMYNIIAPGVTNPLTAAVCFLKTYFAPCF